MKTHINFKKIILIFLILCSNKVHSQIKLSEYKESVNLAWSIASPTLISFKIDPYIVDIIGSAIPGIMDENPTVAINAISKKIYEKTNIKYLNPEFVNTVETSIKNIIPLIKSKNYILATSVFAGIAYTSFNFIKYNQLSKSVPETNTKSENIVTPEKKPTQEVVNSSIENSEFSSGWYIVEPNSEFAILQRSIDDKTGEENLITLNSGESIMAYEFSNNIFYCIQTQGRMIAIKGKNSLTKAKGTGRPCLVKENIAQENYTINKGSTVWLLSISDNFATIELSGRKEIQIPLNKIIILSSAYDNFANSSTFKTVK